MNPNLRIVILVFSLVLLLGLGFWLTPSALGLYYQIKGGQLLDQSLSVMDDGALGRIACDFPYTVNDQVRAQVSQAMENLQNSMKYDPDASHPYLLLGRAHCLLGASESAVKSYLIYTGLRPENPLGHLELGFALDAACRSRKTDSQESRSYCSDSRLQKLIVDEWGKADVVTGQFVEEGDKAFSGQQYEAAARWYQRAAIFGGPLSPSLQFKWSVASIIAGYPLPDQNDQSLTIYPLSNNTVIEAGNLQWVSGSSSLGLNYGDYLRDFPLGSSSFGVMWWASTAIAFVEVPEESVYQITIKAQDTAPGPLKLQIERDFFPFDYFELNKGDNSWHELRTATVLPAGIHIVGIRFLEDTGDLILDSIKLEVK